MHAGSVSAVLLALLALTAGCATEDGAVPNESVTSSAERASVAVLPSPDAATPDETASPAPPAAVAESPDTTASVASDRPLPDQEETIAELFDIIERADGRAIRDRMTELAGYGERIFPLMLEFFRRAEKDRPQLTKLTHDGQLVFGMAYIIINHPDECAAFSEYVLSATANELQSWLRRDLFHKLPTFLRFHYGRYPRLAAVVEREIFRQLELGNYYFHDSMLGVEALGLRPPMAVFEKHLATPGVHAIHSAIIKYLGTLDDAESVAALKRFMDRDPGFATWTTGQALSTLALMTCEEAVRLTARFMRGPTKKGRDLAMLAYFAVERDPDANLEGVLEYLNSNAEQTSKKRLVAKLKANNGALLSLLREHLERIGDEGVKDYLIQQ